MKILQRPGQFLMPLLLLAGGLAFSARAIEPRLALPAGLIHYWRGEDNALDSVGSLDGTPTGAMHYNSGTNGRAFFFLGNGERLLLGGTRLAPPWTFAAWIRREGTQNDSTSLLTDNETAIKLDQYYRTGRLGLTWFGYYDFSFDTSLPLGVWTHVALVGTPFATRLYINGELRQAVTLPFNLPRAFLGGQPLNGDRLVGRIDEMMIFDRALTGDEVRDVFAFKPGLSEQTSISQPGLALDFFQPDAHVRLPHHPPHPSLPMTVATWMQTQQSADSTVASKFDPAAKNGWAITLRGGRLRGAYFGATGSIRDRGEEVDAGFVADGAWHYIAFVVDADSGRLYVDGALRGVRSWTGTPSPATNLNDLVLGGDDVSRSFSPQSFVGQLDEFTWWNVALGERDLQINAQRIFNLWEPGLVVSLRMNEAYGRFITNATGLGPLAYLHGPHPTNSSIWINPSRSGPGYALQFDDPGARVTITDNPAFNAYPLTIMTWFKSSATTRSDLIRKQLTPLDAGYHLSLVDGRLRGGFSRNDGDSAGGPGDGLDAGPVADGQWHHAALVVDEAGAFLYLDHQMRASASWIGTPGAAVTAQPLTFNLSGGALDNLSVWNIALTTDQIRTNRSRLLFKETPGLLAYFNFDEGNGDDTKGVGSTFPSVGQFAGRVSFQPSTAPVGTPGLPPVLIASGPEEDGLIRIQVRGLPGYTYLLSGSQDLQAWTPLDVPAEIRAGLFQPRAPIASQPRCSFYRALAP